MARFVWTGETLVNLDLVTTIIPAAGGGADVFFGGDTEIHLSPAGRAALEAAIRVDDGPKPAPLTNTLVAAILDVAALDVCGPPWREEAAEARRRLARVMRSYGLPCVTHDGRLWTVCGDTALPQACPSAAEVPWQPSDADRSRPVAVSLPTATTPQPPDDEPDQSDDDHVVMATILAAAGRTA